MKLCGRGIFLLVLSLGLLAPIQSKAELHTGTGLPTSGRPVVDPNGSSNNLMSLVSSCLVGRPGDPNSFLPSGNPGTLLQVDGTPPPVPSGGGLPPTGNDFNASAAGGVKPGPASVETVKAFIAANCQKCHAGNPSVAGTDFNSLRIQKGSKSLSFRDVLAAFDAVPKMKSDIPAGVKAQVQAWADAQR